MPRHCLEDHAKRWGRLHLAVFSKTFTEIKRRLRSKHPIHWESGTWTRYVWYMNRWHWYLARALPQDPGSSSSWTSFTWPSWVLVMIQHLEAFATFAPSVGLETSCFSSEPCHCRASCQIVKSSFSDCSNRVAIAAVRLTRTMGTICQILTYHSPTSHPVLGPLSPASRHL